MKKSRKHTSFIFLTALLLSTALHASAYFAVAFYQKEFPSPARVAGKESRVNLLEIGLVNPQTATNSPETIGEEVKIIEEEFLPVPSEIKLARKPVDSAPPAWPPEFPSLTIPPGRAGQAQRTSSPAADAYLDNIRRKIEAAVHYPRRARLSHLEGTVKVGFSIGEAGDLQNPRVIESSPHSILNREALSTLRRAAPFPRAKPSLLGREIAVFIEFKSNY